MKIRTLILPAVAMATLGGCMLTDNGPRETRDHAFTGFDSIVASSGINVVLVQGPFGVTSEAPEGKLDRIVIEQAGKELKLELKSEITWFGYSGRYEVTVSAPAFTAIDASGGADVDAGALQADQLALSASGGGDINITGAQVGALVASASGGGDINIAGTCASATLSASGGGDIDVGARTAATGKASGGGDVRFYGSPATFTKDEAPGGDVSLEAR